MDLNVTAHFKKISQIRCAAGLSSKTKKCVSNGGQTKWASFPNQWYVPGGCWYNDISSTLSVALE